MTCITCEHEHEEKFCPECGETTTVGKITFRSILEDAFSTVTNMNKGFLYNFKNLIFAPRELVTKYIQGKRKDVFNPVSYLIISITVFLVIDSIIRGSQQTLESESDMHSLGVETGRFIRTYFRYFWILAVIWLSLSTKLILRKYNYAEHLTISAFVVGQATLVGMPISFLFDMPIIFNPVVYLSILLMNYRIFYESQRPWITFVKALAVMVLFFVLLLLAISSIVLAKGLN